MLYSVQSEESQRLVCNQKQTKNPRAQVQGPESTSFDPTSLLVAKHGVKTCISNFQTPENPKSSLSMLLLTSLWKSQTSENQMEINRFKTKSASESFSGAVSSTWKSLLKDLRCQENICSFVKLRQVHLTVLIRPPKNEGLIAMFAFCLFLHSLLTSTRPCPPPLSH